MDAVKIAHARLPGHPHIAAWPGRRLAVVRDDATVRVYDLDALFAGDTDPAMALTMPVDRRHAGGFAASPRLDGGVLPATHALIAFDAAGGVRWTRNHQCWGCGQTHGTPAEYADDAGHRYPDSGSAWFSPDGTVVWAHVRERDTEWWLVLDAATGQEVARVDTESAAAGSEPVPHPDGRQVGLSIGEGQDGSPLIWADWDGAHLTASRLGDEHILVAAGGPGFVAVHHARRRELSVHRAPGGEVVGTLFAEGDLRWDFGTGFVDADTYVTSTSLRGHGATDIAHHLVDTRLLESVAVAYPEPVAASPVGLGDGTWVAVAPGDPGRITRWCR